MRIEKMWTMDRASRLRDPVIRREWQETKDKCHEAVGDIVSDSFMSVVRLMVAAPAMVVPRVDTKKPFGKMVQFDPVGRLTDNLGKSVAHALKALITTGVLTGRASALITRRILGI